MKKVFVLRLALVVSILLTVSVASASVNWTMPAVDDAGDWSLADNWDAAPDAATDVTYTGVAGTVSEIEVIGPVSDIEVTGVQTYGLVLHHSGSLVTDVSPLLTIKSGGSLSQGSVSTGTHSYVGKVGISKMVIEAGGTFTTNAKLYIGAYTGSEGTVDVYGTLDLSQERGNLLLGENATTGKGFLNIFDGGVVKLTTFADTFKGFQYKSLGAGSVIDIIGSGVMVSAGNRLTQANEAIGYGQIAGDGVLGNVVAAYDADLNVTTITAIPEPATMILLGLGGLLIRKRR